MLNVIWRTVPPDSHLFEMQIRFVNNSGSCVSILPLLLVRVLWARAKSCQILKLCLLPE